MGIQYGEKRSPFIDYGRPSLFLDFDKRKSLVNAISKNNLITFTRSSTATYVGSDGLIKTAAADEARFDHDPITGESLGLLIEEQRTNLVTYSEDFSNSSWIKGNVTITSNAIVAPDGALTGDKLDFSVTNGVPWFYKDQGTVGNPSLFVKYDNWQYIKFRAGNVLNFALFDLINGTVSVGGSITNASITPVGNGWFRIWANSNQQRYDFRCTNSTADDFITGTGSVFIWGAQMEAGSFPTSYIPTSGSTVTRQADTTTLSNSAFGNITQGTFVFKDFNLRGRNTDSTTDPDEIGVFATFSGTNGENRILTDNNYYVSNSSSDTQTITSGAASRDVITNTPTFTSGVNRIFVSHNVTSTLGSQIRWNFTDANGLPTEVGTVLFLEIYSRRYNNGPSGSRGHYSAIMFNGSIILNSGYQAVVAGSTYERAVRKIVILTESGWEEYQNSPSITTGETASYAYSFEYDGTNTITSSAKGGVLSGSASSSGSKLPSDPSLNLNFNPSSRTYKKIILYPSALTNAQLQSLTQ